MIWAIRPITRQFEKAIGLIPRAKNLPHFLKIKETIPTSIVIPTVEDLVPATLEELANFADYIKHLDQLPPYNEGYEDKVVLSDDTLHRIGGHRDDSSYSEEEEEHKDENMENQDLD